MNQPRPGPATLTALYFGAIDRFPPERIALRAKQEGRWREYPYAEVARTIEAISTGLLAGCRKAHLAMLPCTFEVRSS